MRYIAAYLLLQLGGKTSPGADDIKKVLTAGGVDCDDERLSNLLSELEGKSIDELISAGSAKLASVPSGGGVATSSGGGGAATGGASASAPEKEAEAKKEEPKEESDDDMGFGLFD